jgi:hypothetical protein
MQIEIDFEVYKALTVLRKHERHSYNDVLRELLELDPTVVAEVHPGSLPGIMAQVADHFSNNLLGAPGTFVSRGLHLPDGTKLRARYKGGLYHASIVDGCWIDESGTEHSSPSAAATYITGTTVNGWRFWEAQRPTDTEWRRLDMLASA